MQIDKPAEKLSPAAEAALTVAAEVFSAESQSQEGQQIATLLAEQLVRDPRGGGGTRGRSACTSNLIILAHVSHRWNRAPMRVVLKFIHISPSR